MKENKTLEFKSNITNTFLKTVSAYANFGTGVIEFGKDDNGTVIGIEDPTKACLDIENKINDSISPKPEFTLKVNNRTNVITLEVFEGSYKPYFYKGKAYRRSDTSSIEVDQLELKRLALEGSNLYYEELPYNDSSLTFTYFENKLKNILDVSQLTNDMLRTFGFYTKEKEYNNAAALFADKNNFVGIDTARFRKSISEILDRQTYSNCSILEQYDKIIEQFERYYTYETIEGISREKKELIPETAFREVIANALVHRTWDVRAHIKVSMFNDRIEIVSPGGLPKGISEEEYLNGYVSNLRNPILANIFYRLHFIEKFGTGIRRIIEAYRQFDESPRFKITENTILVILPVIDHPKNLTTDQTKILEVLNSGMKLSSTEIASKLNWSKNKVLRTMVPLTEDECVKISGRGPGTKYYKS